MDRESWGEGRRIDMKEKETKNRQIDKNSPMQVLLARELLHRLKIRAARENTSIKAIIESLVIDYLGPINED